MFYTSLVINSAFFAHLVIAKSCLKVILCRTCTEVVSGISAKCFNTKPRLREAGMEVCLMYVEIDKNEHVQEEIMKGFENKQPKIVQACVDVITTALR